MTSTLLLNTKHHQLWLKKYRYVMFVFSPLMLTKKKNYKNTHDKIKQKCH